jgi:hypothetical protein
MRNDKYLLYEKDKSGNFIHWLNPEIDFILEGPSLKYLRDPIEGIASAQLEHTSHLKEAIRNWIDNFTESSPNFQLGSGKKESDDLSIIDACENHILFRDLSNHLPKLGITICERWSEYKSDILKLLELKVNLLTSLKIGISECFEGLKFDFTSNGKEYPTKYAFLLLAMGLYDMVIHLDPDEKAISQLEHILSSELERIPFFKLEHILSSESDAIILKENGDRIQWGGNRILLSVSKKDQALLESCLKKLLVLGLLSNMPNSNFMVMVKEIKNEVNHLRSKREHIVKELEGAMHYSIFPGECQYLGNTIDKQ